MICTQAGTAVGASEGSRETVVRTTATQRRSVSYAKQRFLGSCAEGSAARRGVEPNAYCVPQSVGELMAVHGWRLMKSRPRMRS